MGPLHPNLKTYFLLFSKIFRPDFDASREKLRRLGDAEGTLTKEEFNKMKQELEAEYLATFKVII